MKPSIEEVEGKQGEKTIEISIRFFTNNIASKPGQVRPKECWEGGMVYLTPNKIHGIKRTSGAPFQSFYELPLAIAEAFREAGVRMHLKSNTVKIVARDDR